MWRRALLLAFFFSVPLLLTPALPAKNKPKSATSDKIQQDFSKFVEIPGAEKAGAEQCAMCHADLSKNFRRSAHSMQDISCEQCHGAGSLHVAAGGYSKPIERQDHQLPRPFRGGSQRRLPELPREIRSCPELVFGRASGAGHQVRRLPHHS